MGQFKMLTTSVSGEILLAFHKPRCRMHSYHDDYWGHANKAMSKSMCCKPYALS